MTEESKNTTEEKIEENTEEKVISTDQKDSNGVESSDATEDKKDQKALEDQKAIDKEAVIKRVREEVDSAVSELEADEQEKIDFENDIVKEMAQKAEADKFEVSNDSPSIQEEGASKDDEKDKAGKEVKKEEYDFSDIFIRDSDRIKVKVQFYFEDGELFVSRVDADFDSFHKDLKEFTVEIKKPSHTDYSKLLASDIIKNPEELTMIDYYRLELYRLFLLMKTWSIPQPISKVDTLDPKLVKSMVLAVREKLGFSSLF